MPSTTPYKRGDVVLVRYPFTDEADAGKQRPAVVVSANTFNNRPYPLNDVILVAVTSSVPAVLEQDQILLVGNELKSAGLYKSSIVRAGAIFTINQERIIKKMGTLSSGTVAKIVAKIYEIIVP